MMVKKPLVRQFGVHQPHNPITLPRVTILMKHENIDARSTSERIRDAERRAGREGQLSGSDQRQAVDLPMPEDQPD
jgi:hypothetical protein